MHLSNGLPLSRADTSNAMTSHGLAANRMSAVSNGLSEKTYECVMVKQRRDKERREMSNQSGIRIVELAILTLELRTHITSNS
jgi:hypothetical protein